jgi:maltose operon protein
MWILICLIVFSLVSGCATIQDLQSKVDQTPICCKTYAEMKFEALGSAEEVEIKLAEGSPVFNFTTGKSYFKAVDLGSGSTKKLIIWSNRTGSSGFETRQFAQVYCPTVQFLTPSYEPLAKDQRSYLTWGTRGKSMFSYYGFRSEFDVPSGARYAIFYTDPATFGQISNMPIGARVSMVGSTPVYSAGSSVPYPCGPVADAIVERR